MVNLSPSFYQNKKPDIYALWENFEPLPKKSRSQANKFIEKFYDTIENPKRLETDIKKKMRPIEGRDKYI